MAITAGNWSSSTDPFLLAFAHAYTGTVGDLTNNRIIVSGAEGFLPAIVEDPNVQELFWSKDTDREVSWPVNAMEEQTSSGLDPTSYERGKWQERQGSSFVTFRGAVSFADDPTNLYIYVTGKSAGAVTYSLFAYTAYTWQFVDPAQVIFSWLAHYVDSPFTLKDYLNQSSFQDASDYYDAHRIDLCLYREVNTSVAAQIKKVMQHTSDFLAIRPADADGAVELHILPRQAGLTQRTTSVDLDSASVSSFTVTPTDQYTLDQVAAIYGGVHGEQSVVGAVNDSPEDYILTDSLEIPGTNRNRFVQRVGGATAGRSLELTLPYHGVRDRIFNHMDIRYWSPDQAEVYAEFADLSHLNFDVGDLVPLTCSRMGYTDKMFLCTEKDLDLNTMLATARFLEIHGTAGSPPAQVDQDNLQFSLAPNALGDFITAQTTFPVDVIRAEDPRNLDRVWDLSGNWRHILEATDLGSANPKVALEQRLRWPALYFDGTAGAQQFFNLGDSRQLSTGSPIPPVSNFTAYFVLNPTNLTPANQILWSNGNAGFTIAFYLQRAASVVCYNYGGTNQGTQAATTGWQILTFVLDSAGGRIRRNGVDLDTGLTYTQTALSSDRQALGVSSQSDTNWLTGYLAEAHIFIAAHTSAEWDEIEAHLADKYGITI